ncbi:uncharacterized protein LOC124541256 [Vanessa cardui]|uniref:uncharacterized protein LOC124541256 n=1 Tax=Vanessa cardui TaxID=171605 RepID=UPI001F1448A2|nr:uncharacterized protein LOC124541256 [Vanessa cardui]
MVYTIYVIAIVIPIFIQGTTQVPIMRRPLTSRHSHPVNTESEGTGLHNIPLNKEKSPPTVNNDNMKKLNSKIYKYLFEKYFKSKPSERTEEDEDYVQYDNNSIGNIMKHYNKEKRAEYDAYGKRYYRVAVEDDGNGVKYDIYEDDAGTRYYKVYVIDDRAGYVVINGVRYYPKTRPSIKQSQKPKVPLNQKIYNNTIQNFKQHNIFNKLSGQKSKTYQSHGFPFKN